MNMLCCLSLAKISVFRHNFIYGDENFENCHFATSRYRDRGVGCFFYSEKKQATDIVV